MQYDIYSWTWQTMIITIIIKQLTMKTSLLDDTIPRSTNTELHMPGAEANALIILYKKTFNSYPSPRHMNALDSRPIRTSIHFCPLSLSFSHYEPPSVFLSSSLFESPCSLPPLSKNFSFFLAIPLYKPLLLLLSFSFCGLLSPCSSLSFPVNLSFLSFSLFDCFLDPFLLSMKFFPCSFPYIFLTQSPCSFPSLFQNLSLFLLFFSLWATFSVPCLLSFWISLLVPFFLTLWTSLFVPLFLSYGPLSLSLSKLLSSLLLKFSLLKNQ